MSYETHMFYRIHCDYPGCDNHYQGHEEYEWWYDTGMADDDIFDDTTWLGLDGISHRCYFCPEHLELADSGAPYTFDEDDANAMPRNAELIPYYLDAGLQPLPLPECEQIILETLKKVAEA